MKVLLTNDDGIFAEGLWSLYRALRDDHEVAVVAPDRERSAVGHGITLNEPLRAEEVTVNGGWRGFAVTGKPADCVKLGLLELLPYRPDVVISGINPGANVGVNLNYSGTVAAAREAALYGIPALAVSILGRKVTDYADAAGFAARLAEEVVSRGLPFGTLLNVNLPNRPLAETGGIRFSRQGIRRLSQEYYERRTDPRDRPYHWLGLDSGDFGEDIDLDRDAVFQNYISITPIRCDATDYGLLESMREWEIGGEWKMEN
jgi:5'-nucleotidase